MNEVKLVWIAPDAEKVMGYCARVSNPANQDNPDVAGLLRYCAKNGHWSVFEMASICIEINTTRDIARQILRHRSFSFQEFSQRYADVDALEQPLLPYREARLQDHKNRQNSLPCDDDDATDYWYAMQEDVHSLTQALYREALQMGIAKEQARALLPEGLTPSRMYMTGSVRSWIHYLQSRLDPATQKEHREIAQQIHALLSELLPNVMVAVEFAPREQPASVAVHPAHKPRRDSDVLKDLQCLYWIMPTAAVVIGLLLAAPFIFGAPAHG